MSFGLLKRCGVTPRSATKGSRSTSELLGISWWLGQPVVGLNIERRDEAVSPARAGRGAA